LFEPEVSRPLEDILRWAGEQHLAVIEKDDLLADCRSETDFMRNDNHRHAFGCQVAHDVQDLAGQFRIER